MEERDETLARLTFTTDLGEFADRDLVIEAVVENEQVKTEIFQVLDQVVTRPDAILASNTSSIPLVKLAVATSRPDQVIGIHFFNPAPVQRLVELIPALTTSDETIKRAEAVVQNVLDKHAIRAQDRSGFVVNALLIPYLLSAIRMFESGIASREDIDNGMEMGCAHPMGPLKLADLIGLDTVASVADSMYAEYKEPLYAAPPLLQRMVDAGGWAGRRGRASTRTTDRPAVGRAGRLARPARRSYEPSPQLRVVEHEQSGGHVGGRYLTARDHVRHEFQRDPLAARGLEVVRGMAGVRRLPGPEEVVPGVHQSVGRFHGHQGPQFAGAPARLLLHLPRRRGGDVLAVLDHPRGEFPAPAVGDEPVPPQEQYLVGLVDHGGRGDGPEPDEEVVQMPAVGENDVRQVDPEPGILVHGLFVQVRPLHSSATFRLVDGNIGAGSASQRNA